MKKKPGYYWWIVVACFAAIVILPKIKGKLPEPPEMKQGYRIEFSSDFKPALASKDELGISVVIAVDVSGSMYDPPAQGGERKYIQATKALLEVLEVVKRLLANSPKNQVIRLGIIKFSDAAEVILPVTTLDAATLESVKNSVDEPETFSPEGKTALGSTIERGTEMLAQSGTILRSLIIITDGVNTAGPLPETVLGAVYNNRNSAFTADFPVFTNTTLISLVGFDIESTHFYELKELGIRVTSASDRNELAKVVSGILEADITKLESGGAK